MIEPQIGEIITVEDVKYVTKLAVNPDTQCDECYLYGKPCMHISCTSFGRKDSKAVIFKKIEEMEVKIQIPDNCEFIKDGDTYIVKEKQIPPRSWKEFCERYPLKPGEAYINPSSEINVAKYKCSRNVLGHKDWCTSKEEAEAFLALMQLRQLRKAWVGDWEQPSSRTCIAVIAYDIDSKEVVIEKGNFWRNVTLSFPTKEMAKDFLDCFRDLCETAKILL